MVDPSVAERFGGVLAAWWIALCLELWESFNPRMGTHRQPVNSQKAKRTLQEPSQQVENTIAIALCKLRLMLMSMSHATCVELSWRQQQQLTLGGWGLGGEAPPGISFNFFVLA